MKKLSILLLLSLSFLSLFAQQTAMPAICKNPPSGIQVGGSFSVSPEYGCLDSTNNKITFSASNGISPSGGVYINLGYIFNFKDGSILQFPSTLQTSFTTDKPGTYWILQGGNDKGSAYITCKSVEIVQPEQPDFIVSSLGNNSIIVTFSNTSKNKKYGKFMIVWGDNTTDLSTISPSLPLHMNHTYRNKPTQPPQIIAQYTRGSTDITFCQGTPISFPVTINSNSRISQLEGLNGGTSAKIIIVEGFENKEYNIQQKIKGGDWIDTAKKIIRDNDAITTQQIDQLDSKNEYCFRLKGKDDFNNEIFSNEVCSIKLNTTLLSDKEIKLDWNSSGSNLTRYTINYNESTGENKNFVYYDTTKTNTYTFKVLECKKKYDLSVIALIGTITSEIVTIKSPKILIDISSLQESPSPDNLVTVSVNSSNNLACSIFEPSGFSKYNYHFYRSVNGGNFEKVGESADYFYNDLNLDIEKKVYCYAYKSENTCGVVSALSINKPCNVKLTLENNTLKWNPYLSDNKSINKPEYYIDLLDEQNTFIKGVGYVYEPFYDVLSIVNDKILKFRIHTIIKYNLSLNGILIPYSIDIYSNTITYLPPLSTSNESEILNIYPNPSEEIIKFNTTFQLKTAEIIDLQGKVIENQVIEDNQVSVKNLPKGKYILRLYNQDKKLLINKTIVKM